MQQFGLKTGSKFVHVLKYKKSVEILLIKLYVNLRGKGSLGFRLRLAKSFGGQKVVKS